MLRKRLHPLICASQPDGRSKRVFPRLSQTIALFVVVGWGAILEGNLSAATVPPGFSESVIDRTRTVTTINVTNTEDSGAGSLRQALLDAQDGDTISFSLAPSSTIVLTSGELTITKNITISGPGADVLSVQRDVAAAAFRVFHVNPGHTVTIEGITISNGIASGGGGIYNDHSTLTVNSCVLSGNSALAGNTQGGGAIFNDGTAGNAALTVVNSTLSGNSAPNSNGFGGGIVSLADNSGFATLGVGNSTLSNNSTPNGFGGGIGSTAYTGGSATLNVVNSTLSGNSSSNGAGGIDTDGNVVTTVTNSTLTGNTGFVATIWNGGTVMIGNTILKAGASGENIRPFGTSIQTSLGYNLCTDNGGGFLTGTGDQLNTDPILGPLANNGGPTKTHSPLTNSPAIDKGKDIGGTGQDQRGSVRPVTYDNSITPPVGGDRSDIGAVELPPGVIPTPTPDETPTPTPTPTGTPTPTATPTPTPTPGTGLVAAYGFDEGSGTAVTDASGFGNTGTVSGTSWTSQGRFGNALTFNGSSWVTVNDSDSLDLTSGMTIEAWVYPTVNPPTWTTVIIKEQPEISNLVYGLFATSPFDRPLVDVFTTSVHELYGPSTVPLNTWTHLVGTYDAVGGQSMYVNGVQVAHVSTTGNMVTSTGVFRMGGNSIFGEYFVGTIDEVRVYNRALSQTEIQADMATPITPQPTPTPALVSISGTVVYCSNPSPAPVPNVTLTLTGSGSGSVLSDGLGNYQFSSLVSGGSYTVTPTSVALVPGSMGIDTVDAIAAQRHFLNLGTPLSGCKLTAADVNGLHGVDTTDVIAIQRFFLGLATGIANTGKYKFSPASRSYPTLVSDQTAQNYDTLIFGDIVAGFVH